jgi:hypothetical protein
MSTLDTLLGLIPADAAGRIAKDLGLDPALVTKALGLAPAFLTKALANQASFKEGADAVYQQLAKADPTVLAKLKDYSKLLGAGGGEAALQGLLGDSTDTVVRALERRTGLPMGAALAAVAPAFGALYAKNIGEGQLDVAGLQKTLKADASAFAKANAEVDAAFKGALDSVKAQGAIRAKFTDAEWKAARTAPVLAACLVMAADPSSGGGTQKELDALASTVRGMGAKGVADGMLDTLYSAGVSQAELDEAMASIRSWDKNALLAGAAGQIATSLNAIAKKLGPEDLVAVKASVYNVASAVAGAAKEGGFLGMGDKAVSDKEAAALEALKMALGI